MIKINEGLCFCHTIPMGENGLEGYERDKEYEFNEYPEHKTFKVYTQINEGLFIDVMNKSTFNKFFTIANQY